MSAMGAVSTASINWAAIDADPRFQLLHRKKTNFLLGLMIFSIVYYFLPQDTTEPVRLSFRDAAGKAIKTRGIRITSKIGNPNHSIWETGDTDRWGEAAFFVKVPRQYRPGGKVLAYIWNPQRQKILVDDLTLELWRKPGKN